METTTGKTERPGRGGVGGKDLLIGVLALAVLLLGGALAQRWWSEAGGGEAADAEAVRVFEIDFDRAERRYIEVLFDQPLGEDRVGEIFGRAPATLSPPISGVWRWRDTHALRFDPTERIPAATEINLALIAERLLPEGVRLAGDTEFLLRSDPFLVEKIEAVEEPALEGEQRNRVFFRGSLRFNYPVSPEELAPRIRLVDPLSEQPIKVELEAGWETTYLDFHTGTVEKKPAERILQLVIDGTLTPADGNVQLAPDGQFRQEIPLGSSERMAVRGIELEPGETESRIRLELSSPVNPALAARYLTIEPAAGGEPLRFRLSGDRNRLVASGPMRPGERYQVTLAAGLPSREDAVLKEPWSVAATLPNLPASLDFDSEGMFLSAAGDHTVALSSINVTRAELSVDRVYRNNLFFLFRYRGFRPTERGWISGGVDSSLGDRLASRTLELGAERNRKAITPVDLDPYIRGERPGLFRLSVKPAGSWTGVERWLLLTDLGLIAKRGSDGLDVWVSSFADLTPVAGAQVRLLSDQNQEIGAGRTDGGGHIRFADTANSDGERRFERDRPYFLTVEKGDDFSFLLFDSTQVDTSGLDVDGATASSKGYRAFLWGERDLYRPGETVEGVAALRDESLAAPPPMPVTLLHLDPRGRPREEWTVQLDRAGLAEFSLDVPSYALTGAHNLELSVADEVVGTYRFQVEEFIPDRIKVEIDPTYPAGKTTVGPGDELAFGVSSSYLFGPPAAGLPVEARVRLVDSTFAPAGFADYSFRNDERVLDDQDILTAEGTLDPQGKSVFGVTIPAGASVPSSLSAVLTARVRETGGRGVTARLAMKVDPYPYYLGLKRPQGYADPERPMTFEWVALAADGGEARSGELRADLFRDRWNTVLRATPGGNYRYETTRESELVESVPLSGGASRGTFAVTPPETGSYRVILSDPSTSASASVQFYASGWGFAPWAIENPARVELDLDREEYAPGDTAVVQVRAPFPGRLLLTVERGRVFDAQIHTLDGNTARIEVPISGAYRPNAYVTATLVRSAADLEPGAPGRAYGAVPLSVDRTSNRLQVSLEAAEEIRPETTLDIAVTAVPGARITVAAVDEGILQLVSQKTPDPFSFFYRKLALGVSTFDLFALLLPEVSPEGAAAVGGGEGAEGLSQYVRTEGIRRVEPVALWSGVLTADGTGRAVASFEVPRFAGALRVMAVALDGRRFGTGEEQVRVRDPLVLLPTVPRVLAPGDRVELPVTVRNDLGAAAEVRLELDASGAARLEGEGGRTLSLENAAETTAYFTAAVGDGDAAELRFSAAAAGESTRAVERVPVRPALPPVSTGRSGAVENDLLTLEVTSPESYRDGSLVRHLHLGPLPLVQFTGRLRDLVMYPYGCLEQTVSTAFPLVYLEDLARRLDPELFEKHDPAVLVRDAVRRITDLQLWNGGFSLWPGGEDSQPWASIYATHFLVEAQKAGFTVEDFVLDNALEFVASEARAKDEYGSEELERMVYALYVLVRAGGGRADLATMDFLRERQAKELGSSSRALLAAAYAGTGDPQAAAELAARIETEERVARQTGGNFGSPLRNRALLLLALLDATPKDPRIPDLVDRLAREAGGVSVWNTQEASFLFLALGRFYQRQAERPPYAGRVVLDGREVGRFRSEPASFRDLRGKGALTVEMDSGYAAGAAFYSLVTRGIPTDEAFQPRRSGLEVERQLLTREGGAADLTAIEQGDLLVLRTRVRSVSGPVENVVVESLLPAGLEVENPRLSTTESLPWVSDANLTPAYLDLRDDRILLFTDLPADTWQTVYALVRAVTPGTFKLPPVHAEAMYDPALSATGPAGEMVVKVGE